MKVIQISNIKKPLILLILLILVFTNGCFIKDLFTTDYESYENSVTLTYDQDITQYLPYNKNDIPSFTFYFDGSINLTKNRTGEFECCFYHNDDFKVSNIVKSIIDEYTKKNRVSYYTVSTKEKSSTTMNRLVDDKYEAITIDLKDGTIYNKLAFITLDNGLNLTMNFCSFTDCDNVTYYRWEDEKSIRFVLHYPLMVAKQNDEKKLFFIALPNQVTLRFDTTTKTVEQIMKNDKFLEDDWYTFKYTESYEKNYNEYVEYYNNFYNGRFVDGKYLYTYLGYDFEIIWSNDNFIMRKCI